MDNNTKKNIILFVESVKVKTSKAFSDEYFEKLKVSFNK